MDHPASSANAAFDSFFVRQVAVMPLLVACCFLLATFWTHPASSARLRQGYQYFFFKFNLEAIIFHVRHLSTAM
jgi:hypothetical protein